MVQFETFPGVTASVYLAAQDDLPEQVLIEYEDGDLSSSEYPNACRYVESQANRDFYIRLDISPQANLVGQRIDYTVYIDGHKVASHTTQITFASETLYSRGQRVSPTILKAFRFAALVQGPDDDEANTAASFERNKSIGCIEIQITRSRYLRSAPYGSSVPSAADQVVSEKVLKGQAKSHVTTSGSTITERAPKQSIYTERFGVVGIVKYFYRARKDLQALMIIPRSPSPPPQDPHNLNGLSEEQLRTRLHQVLEMQASQGADVKIKSEPTSVGARPAKRQKVVNMVLGDDDEFHIDPTSEQQDTVADEIVELE